MNELSVFRLYTIVMKNKENKKQIQGRAGIILKASLKQLEAYLFYFLSFKVNILIHKNEWTHYEASIELLELMLQLKI